MIEFNSLVFFEFGLIANCIFCIFIVVKKIKNLILSTLWFIALSIVALAAVVGALRFGNYGGPEVIEIHQKFVFISSIVFPPSIIIVALFTVNLGSRDIAILRYFIQFLLAGVFSAVALNLVPTKQFDPTNIFHVTLSLTLFSLAKTIVLSIEFNERKKSKSN